MKTTKIVLFLCLTFSGVFGQDIIKVKEGFVVQDDSVILIKYITYNKLRNSYINIQADNDSLALMLQSKVVVPCHDPPPIDLKAKKREAFKSGFLWGLGAAIVAEVAIFLTIPK